MMLAGTVKVVLIVLAENFSNAFASPWLNYIFGAMAGVWFVMMMAGFGGESSR
jgi:hypothetical protein